jgi:outer membrane protein assembly factor BamB
MYSPVIGPDGTIYVTGEDGYNCYLYAVAPEGSLKWKVFISGADTELHATPAVGSDGTIYVAARYSSSEAYIYAFNPDGTLKWKYLVSDSFPSGTAVTIGPDGTIYVPSSGGMYALNPDGTLKWKYSTSNTVYTAAVDSNGNVYFGCYDGYFYALKPDGTLKWKYDVSTVGEYIWEAPVIGPDGTIYAPDNGGYLWAFNPDGTVKWKYGKLTYYSWVWGTTADPVLSPAIDPSGTIYILTYAGKFRALNPDGTARWANDLYKGEEGSFSSSIVMDADGMLYFGDGLGYFWAFTPGGILKWKYTFEEGNSQGRPALGSDGTLYVGAYGGLLYAFVGGGSVEEVTCRLSQKYHPSNIEKAIINKPVWTLKLIGQSYHGKLAIGPDGTIYVARSRNKGEPLIPNLYAVSPDGKIKWTLTFNTTYFLVDGINVDSHGTIFLCADTWFSFLTQSLMPELFIINKDGTIISRQSFPLSEILSYAILHNDTLYLILLNRSAGPVLSGTPVNLVANITTLSYPNYNTPTKKIYLKESIIIDYLAKNPARVLAVTIGPDGTLYTLYTLYNSGMLFFYVKAYNPDGSLKWKTPSFEVSSSPTSLFIYKNRIYYIFFPEVYAFDTSDGSLKAWSYDIILEPLKHASSFTFSSNTLYAVSEKTNPSSLVLYALNPDDLTIKWVTDIPLFSSSPYCPFSMQHDRNGVIYIIHTDLYALNPDGTVWWYYKAPPGSGFIAMMPTGSVIALDAENLYYFSSPPSQQIPPKVSLSLAPNLLPWLLLLIALCLLGITFILKGYATLGLSAFVLAIVDYWLLIRPIATIDALIRTGQEAFQRIIAEIPLSYVLLGAIAVIALFLLIKRRE